MNRIKFKPGDRIRFMEVEAIVVEDNGDNDIIVDIPAQTLVHWSTTARTDTWVFELDGRQCVLVEAS